ncbi:hypothetical protein Q3G72_024479 [Acer saccharum]|nr:hypothetical protein Q3G72_024479 [Acer saccharum]
MLSPTRLDYGQGSRGRSQHGSASVMSPSFWFCRVVGFVGLSNQVRCGFVLLFCMFSSLVVVPPAAVLGLGFLLFCGVFGGGLAGWFSLLCCPVSNFSDIGAYDASVIGV